MPDQERALAAGGGPGAIRKLPVSTISRTGSGWSPAPKEVGVTRHGKGYCVPGLG